MLLTNSILFLETRSESTPGKSVEQPRDHEFEIQWTNMNYYEGSAEGKEAVKGRSLE